MSEPNPALRKSALIRELVDLSRFTDRILSTMGSAVVAVDGDARIAYVNPAAVRLFERPAADMLRRPAGEVLRTRGGGDLVEFGLLQPSAVGEVDLLLPAERAVTVEARISRYVDEHGAPDGFVAILTDLTDVKRAEQDARRKAQLASLGELSAGVAHEIRNPLAGIATSAQLLESRLAEDARCLPLVRVILDETRRLERIVRGLLEYSKPPAPRLSHSSVGPSVERAADLVRADAGERGIAMEVTLAGDLPELWIDGDQLEQVFLNLMRNAVDAMPEGGLLEVVAERVLRAAHVRRSRGRRREDRALPPLPTAPKAEFVEVRVRDTGHGMDADAIDRAFDPFFTTRRAGTGLGLSICQAIVREHGGMIELESEPGRGTTARVALPLEKRLGQRRRD